MQKHDEQNDKNKSFLSAPIQWLITIYLNPLATPYKYRDSTNLDLHILAKKKQKLLKNHKIIANLMNFIIGIQKVITTFKPLNKRERRC